MARNGHWTQGPDSDNMTMARWTLRLLLDRLSAPRNPVPSIIIGPSAPRMAASGLTLLNFSTITTHFHLKTIFMICTAPSPFSLRCLGTAIFSRIPISGSSTKNVPGHGHIKNRGLIAGLSMNVCIPSGFPSSSAKARLSPRVVMLAIPRDRTLTGRFIPAIRAGRPMPIELIRKNS